MWCTGPTWATCSTDAAIFLDPIHVPTPGVISHLWCN
jgi:hypothetical protein